MSAIDENENLPLFLFRAGAVLFLLLLFCVFALYRELAGWSESPARVLVSTPLLAAYALGQGWAFIALYRGDRRASRRLLILLGVVLSLLFLTLDATEMAAGLAAFWIARMPDSLTLRQCFTLLLVVCAAYFAVLLARGVEPDALVGWLLSVPFYCFVLSIAYAAARERRLRAESIALNRELRAMQARLAAAAKQDERLRIAREMHDLLGHHLTALILNLEVAVHKASGEALPHVERSRSLAKLILSDLRAAVSDLRERDNVDFHAALATILEGAPGITLDVDIEQGLRVDDAETAETVLRCVQESLTNTLRHAGATRFRLRLFRRGERLVVEASDDGEVKGALVPGNGLRGMQERVQALAGSLQWREHGGALTLRAELPLVREAP